MIKKRKSEPWARFRYDVNSCQKDSRAKRVKLSRILNGLCEQTVCQTGDVIPRSINGAEAWRASVQEQKLRRRSVSTLQRNAS